MERFKKIEERIQKGYDLILEDNYPGGCDLWLEAWEGIKELLEEGILKDVTGIDDIYKWEEFPSYYIENLEMDLRAAGRIDRNYHRKRMVFCQELIKWSGGDEQLTTNARISLTEAHYDLGETDVAEQLYHEWLHEDPDWGWGYIGWSDLYRLDFDNLQYDKAEEILLTGYARGSLRDKTVLIKRLIELYTTMGISEKADEFKRILNPPVRAQKIGRNEPCPCGSGKKYKKCCGT